MAGSGRDLASFRQRTITALAALVDCPPSILASSDIPKRAPRHTKAAKAKKLSAPWVRFPDSTWAKGWKPKLVRCSR